jgi:hypothetical protein
VNGISKTAQKMTRSTYYFIAFRNYLFLCCTLAQDHSVSSAQAEKFCYTVASLARDEVHLLDVELGMHLVQLAGHRGVLGAPKKQYA